MTEKVNKLSEVFETRMRELMRFEDRTQELIRLCDDRKKRIEHLELVMKSMKEEIRLANEKNRSLESKYNHLLTARRLEVNEAEYQNARKQVSKLVREVETCIALLNE
jgi:hypothetical protein